MPVPMKLNKISTAVDETTGQIMTYNDEIISAVFHSTSSGITESAVDVWGRTPYLQSVASAGDEESPKYHSELTLSEQEFKNIAEEKLTVWIGIMDLYRTLTAQMQAVL